MKKKIPQINGKRVFVSVIAYFTFLVVFAAFISLFKIRLYGGIGWLSMPSRWFYALLFLFYALPFFVALIGAFRQKLFLKTFTRILMLILVVGVVYSGLVYFVRKHHVRVWEESRDAARFINIHSIYHEMIDADKDQLFERIDLPVELYTHKGTDGLYNARLSFIQKENVQVVASEDFIIDSKQERYKDVNFKVNTEAIKDEFEDGFLHASLVVQKELQLSLIDKVALQFYRWAPFVKATRWDGYDPIIYADFVAADDCVKCYRFPIKNEEIQRKPIIFRKYLGDFSRDTNGNGLIDAIVLKIELDSIYEGPVYFQAQLENGVMIMGSSNLTYGVSYFEMVVPSEKLKSINKSGPYAIKTIVLLNNNPYCPGGKCQAENLPPLTLYLDDYVTQEYLLEDLE